MPGFAPLMIGRMVFFISVRDVLAFIFYFPKICLDLLGSIYFIS